MMTLPFTSLPKNDSKGTAQQRILDLEVVILLYSYNPVQSCGLTNPLILDEPESAGESMASA